MSARVETWAWIVQRASAVVLAVGVVVHLATIVYSVRAGLSAQAILSRTQGNLWWLAFYLTFVAAAALHVGIGLRVIVREMTPWHGRSLDGVAALTASLLLVAGWRAALGLFA